MVPERLIVCVASVRRASYSETFIRAHTERLPAQVKLLYGDDFPLFEGDGRRLLSILERAVNAALRRARAPLPTLIETRVLQRHLVRERVSAVLAEYGVVGARMAPACYAAGVPLVVHFHGYDAYRADVLRSYGEAYRKMFRIATAIIAVSRDMERQLARLGAPTDKILYNPCGADTELFRGADPARAGPVFLVVGRFVDKKAPHLALQAFKRVRGTRRDARLVMIGEGPLLESTRQLARAMGVGDAVQFPGSIPHRDVAGAMRSARGLVQLSLRTRDGDSEGTPVVVLEAGAAGLPVVATRHAGIPDVIIDGETGFLVDEGDVEATAAHMIRLAGDRELAFAMGQRAQRHVQASYSLERSVERLWGVIERAAAAPTARR